MYFSAAMQDEAALLAIESRYRSLSVLMDERMRRQWAAAESRSNGWGGVRAVGGVIGMSPNTIRKGLAELTVRDENPEAPVESGLRRSGAGRKKHTEADPELLRALESLVEPARRSAVAPAMDTQEYDPVGAGVDPPQASGTRSSTACSPTSHATGVGDHW